MRDLNGVYAQAFNRRHGRDGHLFQGRYRAILIESDEHLLAAVSYVVRNPVRALCATPGEWRWSSHQAVVGQRPPGFLALDELLSYFAPTRERARELYRALTNEDRDDGVYRCEGVIDGSDDFVRLQLAGVDGSSEIPRAHLRAPRTCARGDPQPSGRHRGRRGRVRMRVHDACDRAAPGPPSLDGEPASEPPPCTDQDLTQLH